MTKYQSKAYITEGRSWDDTDFDDKEEYENYALMIDSSEASPQSSQVHIFTSIDMSLFDYRKSLTVLV